jgi:Phage integrase family
MPQPLLPALAGEPSKWDEALYAFLAEKGRRSGSRRTVEGYARMLWPFFQRLGKTPDRVIPPDVLAWAHGIGLSGKVHRPRPSAPGSPACRPFTGSCDGWTWSSRTRAMRWNGRGAWQLPARGLTAADVRQLLSVVPDSVRGRRDRAILLTLVLTGRRRSEVINLKAGDITVEGDAPMYQYKGKGGKTGRRELPRPAYDAIIATLADCGKTLATVAADESPWQACARPAGITSGTFYGRFRRYLRAAGLAPTGLHILRHTAAKLRREAGESIEAVSSFLDHSSLAVTTVYLRRLEGVEDRMWAEVAAAIGV